MRVQSDTKAAVTNDVKGKQYFVCTMYRVDVLI